MNRLIALSVLLAAPVSAQFLGAPTPLAPLAVVAPAAAPSFAPLLSAAAPAPFLATPALAPPAIAASLPLAAAPFAANRPRPAASPAAEAPAAHFNALFDGAVEPARAMEQVAELLKNERRTAVRLPLLRLQKKLEKSGSATYFRARDARAAKLPVAARDIHVWLVRRAASDPASIAGDFDPVPIPLQGKTSDCAIQSLWNLPALRSLRARFGSYDKLLNAAEAYLAQPIRREGLNDGDSRRLLKHWGWDRSYDRAPSGEEALAAQIRAEGGVLGSYSFKMPLRTALLKTRSFDRSFEHSVAIPAAVFDHGRWWFIVLDSRYAHPKIFSYGELLTLHLEIASMKLL